MVMGQSISARFIYSGDSGVPDTRVNSSIPLPMSGFIVNVLPHPIPPITPPSVQQLAQEKSPTIFGAFPVNSPGSSATSTNAVNGKQLKVISALPPDPSLGASNTITRLVSFVNKSS